MPHSVTPGGGGGAGGGVHILDAGDVHKVDVNSPRKRRERDRNSMPNVVGGGAGAVGGATRQLMLFGRVEARAVSFVGMFFVTLTAASLYSLLAPFFPTVAGACVSWATFAASGLPGSRPL